MEKDSWSISSVLPSIINIYKKLLETIKSILQSMIPQASLRHRQEKGNRSDSILDFLFLLCVIISYRNVQV